MNIEKLEKWKNDNNHVAGYAHFDKKFGLNSAWDYITNPNKVKSHSFFPFITYDQVFYKVSNKKGVVTVKDKIRPICYSSHIDRCIYQYYGFLLNEKYNDYVDKEQISEFVVAYRTNLHKNNIHFAKQAFDFIKQGDCNIIVGDFKGFFDNLDHKQLKRMLCKVLGEEQLPPDWYAVYKNITRYSTWDLIDILKLNGLISEDDIKEKEQAHKEALNGKTRQARKIMKDFDDKIKILNGFDIKDPQARSKKLALTKQQFKEHKKDYVKRHTDTFGIPQGSSVSTVLSNVYMIDFDKKLSELVKKLNGLYLRYSDDFIMVIPQKSTLTMEEVLTYLQEVVLETAQLTLESEKTQLYVYEDNKIFNITNHIRQESQIDYLGFIFDGKEITLRPRTVSKYYYRMYRKLHHIVKCRGITKHNNKISYKQLYKTYTLKGRNGQYDPSHLPQKVIKKSKENPYKSGNFFSYVYKADRIFNSEHVGKEEVNTSDKVLNKKEPITRSTKRHMLKIRQKRDSI